MGSQTFGATAETLQWTTWPFVFLILGVPALVFLINGGIGFIGQLVEVSSSLKTFDYKQFNKLVSDIKSFGANLEGFDKKIEKIRLSSEEIKLMAQESFEGEDDEKEGQEPNKTLEEFWVLYSKARSVFVKALSKLEDPSLFTRPMREQKDAALKELLEKKLINDDQEKFINEAINLERRTKRSRRSLTSEDIKDLRDFSSKAEKSVQKT